jgi:hypothetical protein
MERLITAFASLFATVVSCNNNSVIPVEIDRNMVMDQVYTNEESGMPESHVYYYGKANAPIRFHFSLDGAVIEAGDVFKKTAGEVFLNRKQVQDTDSLYANRRFEADSIGFTQNVVGMELSRIGRIDSGRKQYLLFKFNRHEMNITPYERNYFYILDVSDAANITALGFIATAPEGENKWPYMRFGTNGLHIENEYWDPYDKTERTLWLEQDENRKWFTARAAKD